MEVCSESISSPASLHSGYESESSFYNYIVVSL
jgi:hypothetical protein